MLSVKNIQYCIGKKNILQDINLHFLPGEFNMILGPNGSGKTTLLKIISGELADHQGEVFYEDRQLESIAKSELAKIRAVLTQQSELSFPLTVKEVVMMGRYPHFGFYPQKRDEAICMEVIERMQIGSFMDRNYLTLSGGEKQRVQFARILTQIWEKPAKGYRYLFLDEPLGSLDINYQQEFLQIARDFTRKNTILVAVMHDINLAIQFADRLLFLKEGRIVANGRGKDIIKADLIKAVFGINTVVINNPVNNKPLVVFAD